MRRWTEVGDEVGRMEEEGQQITFGLWAMVKFGAFT